MEADFWHQRDINPHLATFWSQLQIEPGEQVFVPLSGKSLDMLWLRRRYSVLGVDRKTGWSLRIVSRAPFLSVKRIISACCVAIILTCSPLSYRMNPASVIRACPA